MYTLYTRLSMWEVEPTLYWRVKWNGKWTWIKADLNGSGQPYPLTPFDMEIARGGE